VVKPGIPKASVIAGATAAAPATAPAKSTLADWTGGDNDVHDYFPGEKRQRGGRKKRKKNRDGNEVLQNWDDIYDPSRPNSYDAYKHSEEKIREIREWKDRLYAHRMARRTSRDMDSEEEYLRRPMNSACFSPFPLVIIE
jgi:splicing factor 45